VNPTHSQGLRVALQTVDDTGPQQLIKVTGLAGQVIGEAVRSQHFGSSSNPPLDAEGLLIGLGGGHDRAHVLSLESPSKRPTGLATGAHTVYDANGNKTEYSATGIKHTDKTGNVVEMKANAITVKPASASVTLYVGGDGATGSYAVLSTVAGPCMPNIKGRIG
jgi:phage baseplate assembly protein V